MEGVSFSYPSQVGRVFESLNLQLEPGWYGVVGANGEGKSTLLGVLSGELVPEEGTVSIHGASSQDVVWCKQVLSPGDVDALIEDVSSRWDGEAMRLRSVLELDDGDLYRWESCSGGEQKRWQIAAALMRRPPVLLLDEPTNHLDKEAKELLFQALEGYQGVVLLVSHDREVLDRMTQQTLWVEGKRVALYQGGYSEAKGLREASREDYLSRRQQLVDRVDQAQSQYHQASGALKSANARISTRSRMKSVKDHDARSTAAKSKVIKAERRLGQRVSVLSRERERAEQELSEMPYMVKASHGVEVAESKAPGEQVAYLELGEGLHGGARVLLRPRQGGFTLRRGEQWWLQGGNGVGKSTLLKALYQSMPEEHREHVLWLPQELSPESKEALLHDFESMRKDDRIAWLQHIAGLGVDVGRLLEEGLSGQSPGVWRKVMIARSLGLGCWCMLLDEPTNHLDIPSVEALERALAAYTGAMIVISHDNYFGQSLSLRSLVIEDKMMHMT